MSTHATGTFEMNSWDEQPYSEIEGQAKLTRASVTNIFHGDIEAESMLEYLMAYPNQDSANFVGLERMTGRIGDRSGSFVLQQSGIYAQGVVKATWFVVPGSGTGELQGLQGEGGFLWDGQHGKAAVFTLDYDFAQ